ncbi:ParA family protein [Sphingobacterium bambusae]|uniref:ParA family protein n=1 Tax=Sphingobacterium bambusae TaxID=662858 RepID=A0ABW6BLE5_9SPHI|nr:ParA family protein [Sphingobacterium bambusae]WPL49392.1 ParA family protein [Sphingobacterium bambusae]
MVILLGNQKGGAGKSTVTLLLANYLAVNKNRPVTVLDMDYQQSISSKYEKAQLTESMLPYEVLAADLRDFPDLMTVLSKNPDEIVLIDLPGKMDDDDLIPVIRSGDLILCPFGYDQFSVDSTLLFAMVVSKINTSAPLHFIPNRLKSGVKYQTRLEVDKALAGFGHVGRGFPDRIDFQRVDTTCIPTILLPVVLPVLGEIYATFIEREENDA